MARAVAPQHFHNRPRQDGQRGVQGGGQEEGKGTQQNADLLVTIICGFCLAVVFNIINMIPNT